MQLSFNNGAGTAACRADADSEPLTNLAELRQGDCAVIEAIDLPQDMAFRLMELGFVPGAPVEAARSAPGGGPRVFRIDGTEIALRRETADRVMVRR
ncbi:MAG: ferrous iron transport protein A [Bryobacteraceae bacterium]|nr:ferrous iron transport protein A [Bryobacteraceae bacterium]